MSYNSSADCYYVDIPNTYSCDYETSPGHYCGVKPVTHYALAADTPQGWNPKYCRASLGHYCSAEHAVLERTPTLEAAWETANEVFQSERSGYFEYMGPDSWRRLLVNYPNPVPIVAADITPGPVNPQP